MAAEGKIFNLKTYANENYFYAHKEIYRATFIHKLKITAINFLSNVIYNLPLVVGYIYLSVSVYSGTVSLADMTLFVSMYIGFVDQMYNTIGNLSGFRNYAEQSRYSRDFMLLPTKIFSNDDHIKEKINGEHNGHSIEFRNVTFRYPNTEKEVIKNVSFCVGERETVSIIGANGSGKSTLVNLLLRLYEPDSGEILLDGVNIKEYNINSYYEAIACVFQNTTHYAMPIRDYISADKPCDIARAQAAIKQVKLDKWCDELPHGLDTMLTRAFTSKTDSVEPSIGQWQKLSIARAIYKDAPIMILDEPSASLDVDSENEIFNYITQLTVKKTAILISHRLSNIIGCDHIFVLQDGCLVEQGNHQTLLEMGGVYANLFNSQAKYYKEK